MGQFGYKVTYPNLAVHAQAGFARVAHLPRILDSSPRMHLEGSLYLIERGLGEWVAGKGEEGAGIALAPISIANYAAWLANFLEWCEERSNDPCALSYSEILAYQKELLEGTFGRDGSPHSPNTINSYVGVAIDYLRWLAAKGLRAEISVPTKSKAVKVGSSTSAVGHRVRNIEARKGKVRVNPRRLVLPSGTAIERWQGALQAKSETLALMAELVLKTGIRREEAACWRIDTLPAAWVIANPNAHPADQELLVSIKFGVKGPNYGTDNDDKVGPVRTIKLPVYLATKLRNYLENVRPSLLVPFVREGQGLREQRRRRDSVHFFRDVNGARITGKAFYDGWKTGPLPFKEWSPHLGRHHWACSMLWMHYEQQVASVKPMKGTTSSDALFIWADNTIRLHIQPQLGHVSSDTTHLYLQWFADAVGVALPERYQSFIHDDDQ